MAAALLSTSVFSATQAGVQATKAMDQGSHKAQAAADAKVAQRKVKVKKQLTDQSLSKKTLDLPVI